MDDRYIQFGGGMKDVMILIGTTTNSVTGVLSSQYCCSPHIAQPVVITLEVTVGICAALPLDASLGSVPALVSPSFSSLLWWYLVWSHQLAGDNYHFPAMHGDKQ